MEQKYRVRGENVTFEQIYETLQQYLTKLQEQYQVKTLGVFGSYARGEATDSSDLDLLVEFQGDLTFDKYMDLKFFLEGLFDKKIDLVIRDDIKPQIREKVLGETIYVS
ncbi:MAG: nucleotidyltransferase family protein [Xenococcus sp. MO_188.B8]|nr:nucleotidyltransferase family protein [Xenococcus sp. MO_188.B8]